MKGLLQTSWILAILLFSFQATAQIETISREFCFHWNVTLTDATDLSGYDELDDRIHSVIIPGIQIIWESGNEDWEQWNPIIKSSAVLDNNGCVNLTFPVRPTQPGRVRQIRFLVPLQLSHTEFGHDIWGKQIRKSYHAIRILSSDTPDLNWVRDISSGPNGEVFIDTIEYTVNIDSVDPNDPLVMPDVTKSQLMVLAYTFWKNFLLVHRLPSFDIRIAWDQDIANPSSMYSGCNGMWDDRGRSRFTGLSLGNMRETNPDTGAVTVVSGICLANSTPGKYLLFHEIGHAINKDWNLSGDYHADEPSAAMIPGNDTDNFCKQGNISSTTGDWEPLVGVWGHQSREWSGTAAEEGWADFVAYATRLNRSRDTSIKSYNRYNDPFEITTGVWTANPWWHSSYNLNPYNPPGSGAEERYWTKRLCEPPSEFEHLGSARDWTRFIWGLWTNPETNEVFELSDMRNVWKYAKYQILNGSQSVWCLPGRIHNENWHCQLRAMQVIRLIRNEDTLERHVKESKRFNAGVTYAAMEEAAEAIYRRDEDSPQYNEDKYNYFEQTARAAGVKYH